jgi:septation ring formation regulator EzrA
MISIGWGWMILFLILVIVLIFWIISLYKKAHKSPLQNAIERYNKGEIRKVEFDDIIEKIRK